jgi:hypothetical protein
VPGEDPDNNCGDQIGMSILLHCVIIK